MKSNKKIEALLQAEADNHVALEKAVERNKERARSRTEQLLTDPTERDPYLWDDYDVNIELTLADYAAIPVLDRDIFWSIGLSDLISIVNLQVWSELYGATALERYEHAGEQIEKHAMALSKAELQLAAKQGISKDKYADADKRLSQSSDT